VFKVLDRGEWSVFDLPSDALQTASLIAAEEARRTGRDASVNVYSTKKTQCMFVVKFCHAWLDGIWLDD